MELETEGKKELIFAQVTRFEYRLGDTYKVKWIGGPIYELDTRRTHFSTGSEGIFEDGTIREATIDNAGPIVTWDWKGTSIYTSTIYI